MPNDTIFPDLSNSNFDIQYAKRKLLFSDLLKGTVRPGVPGGRDGGTDDPHDDPFYRFGYGAEDVLADGDRTFDVNGFDFHLVGLPEETQAYIVYIDQATGRLTIGPAPEGGDSGSGLGSDRFAAAGEDDVATEERSFDVTGAFNFQITSGAGVIFKINGANSRVELGQTIMNAARFQEAKGADVAAANNLTLGTDGNLFVITGNTQINAITTANWQAGSRIELKFTGTPTVKHNTAGGAGTATLLLSGAVDFVAAVGDSLALRYDGTNWNETRRSLASGIITLANIGVTPNAQGGSISGSTLTLQPASHLFGGVMSTGAQNLAGQKSWFNQQTYFSGLFYNVALPAPGNYSVTADDYTVVLALLTLANSTLTLPTASNGRFLIIKNKNNSGSFVYSFNTTVVDKDGTTSTALTNETIYILQAFSSVWNIINKY